MFDFQPPVPQPPSCPVCTSVMVLKNIFRQQPQDHLIFRCMPCSLEYPVLGGRRD